jgi:hypothetical protein
VQRTPPRQDPTHIPASTVDRPAGRSAPAEPAGGWLLGWQLSRMQVVILSQPGDSRPRDSRGLLQPASSAGWNQDPLCRARTRSRTCCIFTGVGARGQGGHCAGHSCNPCGRSRGRLPQLRRFPWPRRCVSIFLDKKNIRYIGESQSNRPPKRTQRPAHQPRRCPPTAVPPQRSRRCGLPSPSSPPPPCTHRSPPSALSCSSPQI